jgi:hypothetical protein
MIQVFVEITVSFLVSQGKFFWKDRWRIWFHLSKGKEIYFLSFGKMEPNTPTITCDLYSGYGQIFAQ